MFGITNKETIPISFLTDYVAWDNYIAQIWHQLLILLDISKDATIIEIAPGNSTKIAIALANFGFHGTIYLIEPYEDARNNCIQNYTATLPSSTVIPIAKSMQESIQDISLPIDCILSNHPLDDMLMFQVHYEKVNALFNWTNHNNVVIQSDYIALWKEIENDINALQGFKQQIIDEWTQFIHQAKPKRMIINQYASLTLAWHGLSSLNNHAFEILAMIKNNLKTHLIPTEKIQACLNNNYNYNFPPIGNEVLNAKNWLVYNDE